VIYGNEIFLYALHWVALLVIVAATSTLTRARPVTLLLCAVLVGTAGFHNTSLLRDEAAYFDATEAERAVIASGLSPRRQPLRRGGQRR
jgi:hypothetical protein